MPTKPPEQGAKSLDLLVLSIATKHFTVPLPSGKEVIRAVNSYDALANALRLAKKEIRELHDRLFPDGWLIYQTHSPEMKKINEAIALTETGAER